MDVIKMFVKLNLLVICVVLLNFGECKKCSDVFECVKNWVAGALLPNSNLTVEVIDDLQNVTTLNKSLDGNLLSGLTNLLADTFSNLIKESSSMNVHENTTKIYVQTFRINESVFENNIINQTVAITPDLIEIINDNREDVPTIKAEENSTSMTYRKDKITEINNTYNATVTVTPTSKVTNAKPDIIKNNNNNENMQLEYSNNATNYIKEQEKTTTSISFRNDGITKNNELFDRTTNKSITEPTTTQIELSENNNNDSNTLIKTDTSVLELVQIGKDDPLKIDINVNYISDAYDGDNEIDIGELEPDNLTDYLDIDYTDIYKDTTNEDVEYTPAIYIPTTTEAVQNRINKYKDASNAKKPSDKRSVLDTDEILKTLNHKPTDGIDSVYPWVATVFVMNGESKQFEYICDGTLLSERIVLTAARCVMKANVTVDVANILIILGKRSLQEMAPNEIVLRVKSIRVHDNFVSTEGNVDNDLAIVTLAEPVLFNDDIRLAPLEVEDTSVPLAIATTGWHVSGPLQPLYLDPQSTENCSANSKNNLCAKLGDSETTCPSYGGLLVDRKDDNQWRLKGIASGNPTSEGVCFNKYLTFTKIGNYLDWIMKNVQEASSK